jgi:hypothetical protein
MQHSSRTNPCPVCLRDTDDKCRISDDMIFCYYGDSFHPPAHLEIGDKINVNGATWRLTSLEAGFSDNSYLFTRCIEEAAAIAGLRDRRQKRNGTIKTVAWQPEFKKTRKLLHKALSVPEFERLNIDGLEAGRDATEEALEECENLLLKISAYKSRMILKKNTVLALRYWRKILQFRLRDFAAFEHRVLGVPFVPPERPAWLPAKPPTAEEAGTDDDCWF